MSDVNVSVTDSSVNVMVGEQRYYGSFYSTVDQTNAGAAVENYMTCNVTDLSHGVTVVDSSKFTIANAGIYNIQFSAQFDKTDGGDDTVEVWLRKNNNTVENSDTHLTLHSQDGKAVAAWNWFMSAVPGDYFQILWYSADTNLFINYIAAQINPKRPATPSVIVTINRVG